MKCRGNASGFSPVIAVFTLFLFLAVQGCSGGAGVSQTSNNPPSQPGRNID
ncbi:MAG: hypothetical protein P8Y80_06310 [Acidobacteriota bacterium]